MQRLTIKTSTVFVSVGKETKVYRSLAEVPPPVRKKLVESTTGINSATILIADRQGRREIDRALRSMPADVRSSMTPVVEDKTAKTASHAAIFLRRHWTSIATLVTALALAGYAALQR